MKLSLKMKNFHTKLYGVKTWHRGREGVAVATVAKLCDGDLNLLLPFCLLSGSD